MILALFNLFWVAPLCVLLLLLSPAGSRRLIPPHHTIKRLPWQTWLCSIALLELLLIGSYLGIASLCGTFFTVNTENHPALFENTLQTLFLHDGLFPWSLYALIAAGMGYAAYHDETDAYMSNLLKPFVKIDPQSFFGIIANIGMRRCVIFSISILFMMTALTLTNFLLPLHIHIAHGFNAPAIILTIVLFLPAYSDTLKPYFLKLFSRTIPTYLSIPLFCVLIGAVCTLLSLLASGLYTNKATPEPPLAALWIHYDWQTAWTLFSVLWFLCLTPMLCAAIGRISAGYSVRQVILGVLTTPLLISFALFISSKGVFNITLSPFFILFVSALSFLILMPLLINHPTLSNTMYAYIPKNGIHKHRDHHSFIIEIIRATAVCLFLYLTIGMNGLALLLFAPNFLSIFTLPLTGLAVTKRLKALR